MEPLLIGVILTIVVMTLVLCFKGGDENVEGKRDRVAFGVFVKKIVQRIRHCRLQLFSEGEKNVLNQLKVLKDLIDLNAEATKIHKAVCDLLEDAVTVNFLKGDEIRSFQNEIKYLKQEMRDEKARWECVEEDLKQEIRDERVELEHEKEDVRTGWECVEKDLKQEIRDERVEWEREMEDFRTELAQWWTKQLEEREKQWETQKEAPVEEHKKGWNIEIGILMMQLKSPKRFVQYREWNKIFQRLVAWNVGLSWYRVAKQLKREGNNWKAGMHRKVNKILKIFNVGKNKQFSIHHWNLSMMLEDASNEICHDKTIRNLQDAPLKIAIETELAVLRGEEGVVGGFGGVYDDMMKNVFIVLKNHSKEVSQMKEAQAKA